MSVLDLEAFAGDRSADLIRSHYLAHTTLLITRARRSFEQLIQMLDLVDITWFPTAGQQALYGALVELAPTCHEDSVVTISSLVAAAEARAGKAGWARQQINGLLLLPVAPSWEFWRDHVMPIWRRLRRRLEILQSVSEIDDTLATSCNDQAWQEATQKATTILGLLEGASTETDDVHPLVAAQHRALGPVLEHQFVSSGITALDAYLEGGFLAPETAQTGRLIAIAGRPATGKSLIGLTLALNVATSDHQSLYVSLEMSPAQMSNRILAAMDYQSCLLSGGTPITISQVRQQSFTPEQRERLRSLPTEALASNLRFQRGGYSITTSRLVAQIQLAKRRDPRLTLVVVDYLTLVDYESPDEKNPARAVGTLTKALKRCALLLSIDIVILCQLNRAVESRTDKRPTLSDLRESGRIEEDCDIVIGLHRPAYYDPGQADPYLLELLVLKNREGCVGTIPTTFLGAHGLVMGRGAPLISSTSAAAELPQLEEGPAPVDLGWGVPADRTAARRSNSHAMEG